MSENSIYTAPFTGGINTEQSSVEDLPTYSSDELNCTVYPEGIRGRRFGVNVERDGDYFQLSKPATSFAGYFWKNVGKTPADFIVYQTDSILHFYNADNKPFSTSKIAATVDLTNYITDINNFYQYPVRFVAGDGKLMVVSKYVMPVNISYDFDKQTFNVEKVVIKYRDLEGVEDNLKIDEQPTTLSKSHKYNLLNQGWEQSQIDAFFKDKQRYPANNLQWWIGKDDSGLYKTEKLLQHYFGNTKAPKGHFILDYFDRRRDLASGIYSKAARQATYYKNQYIRVHDRSLQAAPLKQFSVVIPNSSGTATTISLNFTEIVTKIAKKASGDWRGRGVYKIYGRLGNNWTLVHQDTSQIYGKGRVDINFSSSSAVKKYEQYKVEVFFDRNENGTPDCPAPFLVGCTISLPIAEDGNPFSYSQGLERVTDVAYMSGKYFYLTGDTVLFSQNVTEENKGFDKCYQDADPASEDVLDILPTDGGYVKFQTMGDGKALKVFNRGVLVFGRDSVHGLISPVSGRFTATEYERVELSKAGLSGAQSVVSVANFVYYWSPLGIFRIGVNPQTGTTMVAENVSKDTIQTYYNNIPAFAKEFCRAAFDYSNNRIYWFYPLDPNDTNKLNGVLVYDLNYNAFYPFKISDGGKIVAVFETVNNYEIAPTMFLRAGAQRVVAGDQAVTASEQNDKYSRFVAIQHCILTDDNKISFGDFNSREFIDWDSASYDSYIVSRPMSAEGISRYGKVVTGTYENKQVPILQTLFKRTEEGPLRTPKNFIASSGAFIRLRWGWSLSDKSNRWDILQNGYRPQKDFLHDEYVESRLHVRGRGKAYQVEVRNDSNKDFRLAGMNLLVRM